MIMDRRKALFVALVVSSLFFAFSWLPAPRLFDIACILLILLFVPLTLTPGARRLRRDPTILLAMCFFSYIVVSIIWHRLTLPDIFPPTTSDRRFLRVLYFIAIAYAIARGGLITAWHLLVVALSGLLVYLAISFDPNEWLRAWQGHRVDFGIHNAQHTGVVFATCAIAFCVFTPRCIAWTRRMPPAARAICILCWTAALLFSLWGVFVSQTRGVWLGLSITLLLLPALLYSAQLLRDKPLLSLRKPLLAGLAGMVVIGLVATHLDWHRLVSDRLASETVTWESLRQAAAHKEHDLSSIEIRVASWSAATDWIMEKPFMGWGGRGSRPLIRNSDLFSDAFKKQFNHLHNSYLQVLVEIGLLGALFILALIVLLGRASIKAYQRHSMPMDVFLFAWLFFPFWLVVNIFESYIIYPSGTYLVAIVVSFFYSFCLQDRALSR